MSLRAFAEQAGYPYSTVARWCGEGRIQGAVLHRTPVSSYWMVPRAALDNLVAPRRGRPRDVLKRTGTEKEKSKKKQTPPTES